jgi:glutamate-1-semialdehyde 2,1-aminomutase
MFHLGFTRLRKVGDYRETLSYDKVKLGRFISAMHDEGIRIIGRGLWYISTAHTEAEIDQTIEVSRRVFREL